MKKHSGMVLTAAIMILVFGLILFAMAHIVTGSILGASAQTPPTIQSIINAADNTSYAVMAVGALMLCLGLFMRTGPD